MICVSYSTKQNVKQGNLCHKSMVRCFLTKTILSVFSIKKTHKYFVLCNNYINFALYLQKAH